MSDSIRKFIKSCSLCNNDDFIEDEFGCLACTECGSLSKNHIKVELDYNDVNKRMRSTIENYNKNEDENDCELEVNNNIEEKFTNCNTSIIICDSDTQIFDFKLKEKI